MSIDSKKIDFLLFNEFINYLSKQGFIIGVDHHLRLQTLLNKIGTDCHPSELKYLLCPIFATNEKEQRIFYNAFESYFNLLKIDTLKKKFRPIERQISIEPPDKFIKNRIKSNFSRYTSPLKNKIKSLLQSQVIWKCIFILLGILLLLTIILVLNKSIPEDKNKPIDHQVEAELSKTSVPSEAEEGKNIFGNIFFNIFFFSPLIYFLLSELYRLRRRKLVLIRESNKKLPFFWPIKLEPTNVNFLKNDQFYATSTFLKKRINDEIIQLDVDRSISKTIDQGGFPYFQYKSLTKPAEYLILIDYPTHWNHHAKLCDSLVSLLKKEDVIITSYFYKNDPRICFEKPDGERIYLTDLQNRFSDHRLIIFGTGDELLDPICGELKDWTNIFYAWKQRAILTPEIPKKWSLREIVLAQEFIILPAVVSSLEALVDCYDMSNGQELKDWIEKDQTKIPPQAENINALRDYLGNDAFQWLCACAVYPEIRWDLTLFLGKLPCMPENLVNEDNLFHLIRLPWFHTGKMPDELRWEFITKLDKKINNGVRSAIIAILENNPAPENSYAYDDYRLNLSIQKWMLHDKKSKYLKKIKKDIDSFEQAKFNQDYTIIKFLESIYSSTLNTIVPDYLYKKVLRNGLALFGLKTSSKLFFTILVMFFIWLTFEKPGVILLPGLLFLCFSMAKMTENINLRNHPKGLIVAFFANMGERFGFYTMMACLVFFMQARYDLAADKAGDYYSWFYTLIYGLALIGGFIADRTQNYKGTISIGIFTMLIGYTLMAIPRMGLGFNLIALFVIAFGNGLFKGNLQALVGQLYDDPKYKGLRDSAFSLFYMGIMIGAFFAPSAATGIRNWFLKNKGFIYDADLPSLCHSYLSGTIIDTTNFHRLAEKVNGTAINDLTTFARDYIDVFSTGYNLAFGIAAVSMFISLVVYIMFKRILPDRKKQVEQNKVIIKMPWSEEKPRIVALLFVFLVVIFFWMSFHQNGLTQSFFARDYTVKEVGAFTYMFFDLKALMSIISTIIGLVILLRKNSQFMSKIVGSGLALIGGLLTYYFYSQYQYSNPIEPELFQQFNPIFIIFLTPVVVGYLGYLRQRGKEPSTPKKIGIGMILAALGFVVMLVGSLHLISPSGLGYVPTPERVSPYWLINSYLLLTVAELFLSPMGISFVSKVAPPRFQGLMQGGWLAATALGNKLLFIGGLMWIRIELWQLWLIFVFCCLLSAAFIFSIMKRLELVTKT